MCPLPFLPYPEQQFPDPAVSTQQAQHPSVPSFKQEPLPSLGPQPTWSPRLAQGLSSEGKGSCSSVVLSQEAPPWEEGKGLP
jgi:hypothetical protein